MWTLDAFMFFGAVSGVLKISNIRCWILSMEILPPPSNMELGLGVVRLTYAGVSMITLAPTILIGVETVYRLLIFLYRFASPVFGSLEAEGCGYCHYAQSGHGGA